MPITSGASSGNSTSSPSQSPSPSILDLLHKYKYTKKTGSNEEKVKSECSSAAGPAKNTMENGGMLAGRAPALKEASSVKNSDNLDDVPCIPETPESDIPSPGSPVIVPVIQKRLGRVISTDSDDSEIDVGEEDAPSTDESEDDSHQVTNRHTAATISKTLGCNDSESPLPPSFKSKNSKKLSPNKQRAILLASSSDSDETATPATASGKPSHTLSPSESETEDDQMSNIKTNGEKAKPCPSSNKRGIKYISDNESDGGEGDNDSRSSSSRPPPSKKGRVVDSDEEYLPYSPKNKDKGTKPKTNQKKRGVVFISEDEDSENSEVVVVSDGDSDNQSASSSSGSEKQKSATSSSDEESTTERSASSRNSPAVTNQKKKIFDVAKFKSAIAKGLTVSRNNRQEDRIQRKAQADLLFSVERKPVKELPVYDSDDDGATNRRENPERVAVTSFFNHASLEELSCIPGCRQSKVDALLKLRPFRNWADLLRKVSNDKNLSTDMLNGAQEVMTVRSVVMGLMKRCEKISSEIEQLVNGLMDGSQAGHIGQQPSILNPNVRLASYQLLGLNWLALMHRQNLNGILADEMGLGKTVQAISFLSYLLEEGDHGPHLIVVPSSTLDNWVRELHTWCSRLEVIVYYGSQAQRQRIRHEIMKGRKSDFQVLVTTYNIVSSSADDKKLIKRIGFHYVIFDEAHMLKNMTTIRFKNLMRIMAKRRLLLTGTPLQNSLIELMSLLIFVMPDIFYGKTEEIKQLFTRRVFGTEGEANNFEQERIEHAKRIMRPFVLRRLKKDVLRDLPAKHEKIEHVPLTESQRKLYDDLISSFSKQVQENKEAAITNSGIGMMMQLRKLANHPLLLRNRYTEEKLREMSSLMLKEPTHFQADPNIIYEDMEVMSDFELDLLCRRYKSLENYKLEADDILDSGKFRFLDRILPDLKEKGHRVLLFSQFTMVLDIVEWYMTHRKHTFLRLDGQTRVDLRQDLIDQYTNDDIFIFLLSTRAGGLGINLTAADKVIIHDIDFNPYNDKQAEDRCHRVGQTKEVSVIRLISSNTIEEGMLRCAQEKLKLEQHVTGAEADSEKESKKDVATLLQTALGL